MRKGLCLLAMIALGIVLVAVALGMPEVGDPGAPAHNEVPARYLDQGWSETGATNSVAAIILDYRAFDTLGEATVLFAALAATLAVLAVGKGAGL